LPPTIDDNVAGFHPLINTKLLEAEEVKPRIYIMSRRWDHNAESDSELATALERDRSHRDAGYDRIHGDDPIPGISSTIAMTGDVEDVEVDITAGQKMLSAMSGSLLTSLLGKLSSPSGSLHTHLKVCSNSS
jgi:hypothetical protein